MKRLATAIAAIALIGTPAFAADMAVKAPPPAPPLAPVSTAGTSVSTRVADGAIMAGSIIPSHRPSVLPALVVALHSGSTTRLPDMARLLRRPFH